MPNITQLNVVDEALAKSVDVAAQVDALATAYRSAMEVLAHERAGGYPGGHYLEVFESFRKHVREIKAACRLDEQLGDAVEIYVASIQNLPEHELLLGALNDIEVAMEAAKAGQILAGLADATHLSNANHDYRTILQPEIDISLESLSKSREGRSIMIGAGALPISSYFMADQLGHKRCIAIDHDSLAASIGARVLRSLGSGVTYVHASGEDFEFLPDDVPLIATMVSNRVAVLKHLHRCGVERVLLRNVLGPARLCYRGTDLGELNAAGYSLAETVSSSDNILVTGLLLERVPRLRIDR